MEFTANQIAELVNGKVEGDSNASVSDFSKIEDARSGTLTFLANPKYEPHIYNTKATIALVNDSFLASEELPENLTLIKVKNAYESLAELMRLYDEVNTQNEGVDDQAFIHPSAQIGESVYIGAFSYIGANAIIGDNCQIYPNSHIGISSHIGEGLSLIHI